jgi:hypothetical protein
MMVSNIRGTSTLDVAEQKSLVRKAVDKFKIWVKKNHHYSNFSSKSFDWPN